MSKEKWNDVWNIMKNHHLEFDNNCSNKVICIICNKVLINAHNGPCGCRYCLECITKYLNGEEKICPGKTVYCKSELLNVNRDIHIDQPIIRKIMEIVVKCPQQNCDFRAELINITNHIRICNSRSDECPYLNMGCKEFNAVNTDMKKHMLVEIVSHTKLLFEYIKNLKLEIKVMKEDKVELDKNNKDLKKCINDLQVKYESENREIKENLTELKNAFAEEQKKVNELKNEIKLMNDGGEIMKKDLTGNKKCINDSNIKCENENRKIKEKIKEIENRLFDEQENGVELKKEVKEMNDERELMKQDLSENKRETATKIDEINKIITDLKSISNESDKSISNVMNKMRVLQMIQEQVNYGGLVWRIDKWREKTERARSNSYYSIVSESFCSHRKGYKMRLYVWPNGCGSGEGTHLSVWCYVMRGKCDDILSWPFKHGVTFELIDQHTTQIHTSSTLKYDDQYEYDGDIYYRKDNQKMIEKDDSNLICYNRKFISLKELSNNRSLIDNDQILIRCKVMIID